MRKPSTLTNNVPLWRILVFVVGLGIVFIIYLVRLFNLQVIQYEDWLAQSDENRTHEINLQAPRGIIYDRNGIVLAQNIPSYNIVITPVGLPDDTGEIQAIFAALSELTGVPINRNSLDIPYVPCTSDHGISQIVEYGNTTAPYEPVRIACDVSREIALVVEENQEQWPGA
jgi:penicillin-binding protein 2